MTVAAERYAYPSAPDPLECVDSIRTMTDANDQLLAARAAHFRAQSPVPQRQSQVDNALILEQYALDDPQLTITTRLSLLEASLYCRTQDLYQIYPDAVDANDEATNRPMARAYRYVSRSILQVEDLDSEILFPPWSDADIDRGAKDMDFNPQYIFAHLAHLEGQLEQPQPSDEAQRYAPLIQDIHQKMALHSGFTAVPDGTKLTDWSNVGDCLQLVDYGEHYRTTLEAITGTELGRKYIHLIGEMSQLAHLLAGNFPGRYQAGVEMGFKHVLADAMYAMLNHADHNNRTDTAIELLSGVKLPLQLAGEEPLQLLEALHTTTSVLTQYGLLHTIPVAKTEDFSLLRFTDVGYHLNGASVYLRPEGSEVFDPTLEHGRLGKGVEPSISYVVDVAHQPGVLSSIGKYRGSNDTNISIRLDREGIAPHLRGTGVEHDPTCLEGTLSLDVGSVLGKGLSADLGRWLAHGNVVRARTRAEATTRLNHVTEYFTAEDGRADIFAGAARQLITHLGHSQLSIITLAERAEALKQPAKLWPRA